MKPKTEKKCKVCGKAFRPYKRTDKFCSFECARSEAKPINKTVKPIRQFSKKRASENREYLKKRKAFLSRPENRYCQVAQELFNKTIPTTEIHHKAGRIGDLLLDESLWLAVSLEGHRWIHNNPEEAYKRGFLIRSTTV